MTNDKDQYGRPVSIPFGQEHACVVIDMGDLIDADHDLHSVQLNFQCELGEMTDLVKKARAILRRLHDEAWEQSRLVQVGGSACTARFIDVIPGGGTGR